MPVRDPIKLAPCLYVNPPNQLNLRRGSKLDPNSANFGHLFVPCPQSADHCLQNARHYPMNAKHSPWSARYSLTSARHCPTAPGP